MNYEQKQKNKNSNDLLQTIRCLSAQSNESSNIILQAISSGLASGISQGIASGNISVTFDDILSLANTFKPSEEIPLQLVEKIPKVTTGLEQYPSSDTNHSRNETVAKVLSNPGSHDVNQASPGFPSSVHVFDVTTENCPAHELSVSQWVSETGDDGNTKGTCVSIDSETDTGGQSAVVTDKYFSKKRSSPFNGEEEETYRLTMRPRNGTQDSMFKHLIDNVKQLRDYVSLAEQSIPDRLRIAHNKSLRNNDLCNDKHVQYYDQSLIVMESVATTDDLMDVEDTSSKLCPDFFQKNKVSRLIVVERPNESDQVYIADGLRHKYHFSCPTAYVPYLFEELRDQNNNKLELLFIPRSLQYFKNRAITVFNDLSIGNEFCPEESINVYRAVYDSGGTQSTSGKRSNCSTSIGLQTMYSHEQHRARCLMLPHSKPHALTVRKYPPILIKSFMKIYKSMVAILDKEKESFPFHIDDKNASNAGEIRERLLLRGDLIQHLCSLTDTSIPDPPSTDMMFESCTVQPTSALGFHQDVMNCPDLDKTIACIIPMVKSTDENKEGGCLSYLFYSRKCVSDYSKKKSKWEAYIQNSVNCDLTRLCLISILQIGGVFDYQGSLFEAKDSLNQIAKTYKNMKEYSCPDVEMLCGLDCFKHGAAFDKMGYYSILVNVFFTFYYKGIITNIDDSICLCMFFGLICNGTSALAAVWGCFYDLQEDVQQRLKKKNHKTKLFDMLLKLNRVVINRSQDPDATVSYGNCKMPRFQYANHASSVIDNATKIHDTVKEFLAWRSSTGNTKDVSFQHNFLMNKLKKVKGVGPLSYNQLWHSMCICGILPPDYIQASAIAPASGPAKLVKMFYPYLTKPTMLTKKLYEVKTELNKLGIKTVTGFFLENMMCEIWRLLSSTKLLNSALSIDEKREILFNKDFKLALQMAKPTRYPDIYYMNPFTEEYQHLFRVLNKELVMRPSFYKNDVSGSVNIPCHIEYNETSEKVVVHWSQDTFKKMQRDPKDLFI